MFSAVMKIIPQLEASTLGRMERLLNTRFARVTRRFGRGLVNIMRGAGPVGLALGALSKVLNPMSGIDETMDKALGFADNIGTYAQLFNADAGNLAKLFQFGMARGLEFEDVANLMSRFQGAVEKAKANPNEPSVVRQFTGYDDMSEGFYSFIVSLNKASETQRRLAQEAVFGQRQILKNAEFVFQDFEQKWKDTGLDKVSARELGAAIDKMGNLEDRLSDRRASQEVQGFLAVSRNMNTGLIDARLSRERQEMQREAARLKSYKDTAAIAETMNKIGEMIDKLVALAGQWINFIIPEVKTFMGNMKQLLNSNLVKGILRVVGKGD